MLNQILRVFILDLRGRENHKILSVGEGMANLVNGEADFGSLCVIGIDDLGGTVLSCPLHGMSCYTLFFVVVPLGSYMHLRIFRTIEIKLHIFIL